MTTKTLIRTLLALLIVGAPAFALAQTVNTTAAVTAPGASASVSLSAKDKGAVTKADQEIKRRIDALAALSTRITAMVRVSADFKTSLATAVKNQSDAFIQLQTKIDADTDAATLKTDVQSITQSYRIFALILPQVRISAAADRLVNITTMFAAVGTKLQARITAAGQAGADTTAMNAALADIAAKMSDAQTQAQAAVSTTVTLQPDNGDKTVMAANTKALVAAKAQIVAAQKDLQAARKDIDTILKALKSVSVTASSTTSVH